MLLSYFMSFSIGIRFFYNFVMQTFFGETSAAFIDWEESPFQAEVGYASFGFALVGFLTFRRGFDLRLAGVVGVAAFLWGAADGHIVEIVRMANYASGHGTQIDQHHRTLSRRFRRRRRLASIWHHSVVVARAPVGHESGFSSAIPVDHGVVRNLDLWAYRRGRHICLLEARQRSAKTTDNNNEQISG